MCIRDSDNDMRYGYPDGDLGRIKTQQAFLTAMVDQLLQIKNVTKINQFIQDVYKRQSSDRAQRYWSSICRLRRKASRCPTASCYT